MSTTPKNDKPKKPAAETPAIYEMTAPGPLKVGGVLAYRGARLTLTASQAETVNRHQPGALRFLGV